MTRILLIRHGTNDLFGRVLYGRTPGVHLNAEGKRQAQDLSRILKERHKLAAVVSSPLERAAQTAGPIADAQKLNVLTEDALNEIDFGTWVGRPFSELKDWPQWQEYNQLRSLSRAPSGESLLDAQARAWKGLELISTRYAEGTVAVVTHADIIRALLVLLLGMPLDHALRLEVAPASVSEVLLGRQDPLVRTINETLIVNTAESAT